VLNAHVLILDEPTTALDMLTQASVLAIIRKVHAERHLTTLIISHDMGVVADLADRMAVMYAGRIVEEGPTAKVLTDPKHPYTRGLLTAMPRITGDVAAAQPLPGRVPDLASVPRQGCVFLPRCPLATEACAAAEPPDTVLPDTVLGDTVLGDTVPPDTVLGDTVLGDTVLGDHRFACYVTAGEAA
jgi:peptide/nickel transport system ATP-binding protein